MKTIFVISVLVIILNSMSLHAEIPVLSVDEIGNETTTMMSDRDYEKVMALEADTFAQAAEDQMTSSFLTTHLTLKGILIGLEAQGNVGPTPLKIGAGINQQFYFEIKN